MGYAGKVKLQSRAIALRKKGVSIREIQKKLHISRSSASIWVRDVKLSKVQIKNLYTNKTNGGLKGSYIASQNKIKDRLRLTKKIKDEGVREIGKLTKRDKFIAGIALYFGEGNKMDKSVAVTNANPYAMKFLVEWLKEFCKVPTAKLRMNLYIHDNLSEPYARKYWSALLGIPKSQFTKSYIVKNNLKRFRKSKHRFGVLRVTVSDVNLHRRIMGWISGVFEL